MKPYHKNPRRISDKQLTDLEQWLAELGDLSGIVHDLNSDQVIGGNQRSRIFNVNECEIVLTEEYTHPDEQGTVGLGYIVWQGNKYAYRQVRWTARQAEQANIVANRAGGEWDFELLASNFAVDDLLAWGFEAVELNGTNDIELSAGIDNVPEQWAILIECENEGEQTMLLERFSEEGIRCRALLS
jgi:hypothetical protein